MCCVHSIYNEFRLIAKVFPPFSIHLIARRGDAPSVQCNCLWRSFGDQTDSTQYLYCVVVSLIHKAFQSFDPLTRLINQKWDGSKHANCRVVWNMESFFLSFWGLLTRLNSILVFDLTPILPSTNPFHFNLITIDYWWAVVSLQYCWTMYSYITWSVPAEPGKLGIKGIPTHEYLMFIGHTVDGWKYTIV